MRAGVGKIKTETDFLRALGYIASYSCDAPMQISLTFDETSFFLWISAGNKLSADDMKGKLYP